MVVVVMGVAGSGKTTVGREVARRKGWEFVDGDELHPPENVRKMATGIPLTDQDRKPWLDRLRERIEVGAAGSSSVVVTCSALKRRYRQILMRGVADVRLVYLKGDFELIEQRLARRKDHFFDRDLLGSQFDALEEPGSEALTVDIDADLDSVVDAVLQELDA